jgi:hypothetical protein
MRLYGLVKNLGSTDDLHRQSVVILCSLNHTGGKAIRAFVSRLDAELMTRSRGLEEYRVVPLRTFDPTPFIQEHQGWPSLANPSQRHIFRHSRQLSCAVRPDRQSLALRRD